MKINWTPRGRKRFFAISNYIATEFYSDYADAWEEDVATTVEPLAVHPELGTIAFPFLKRPELRRVQVAKGRILSSSHDILEIVFDDPIAIGKYVIAVYTRCGHDSNYRVVRISRKIRAVG